MRPARTTQSTAGSARERTWPTVRGGRGGGGGSVGAVAQRVEEPAVGTGILAALGLRPDLGAAPQAGGARGPPLRRDGRRRGERGWWGALVPRPSPGQGRGARGSNR